MLCFVLIVFFLILHFVLRSGEGFLNCFSLRFKHHHILEIHLSLALFMISDDLCYVYQGLF